MKRVLQTLILLSALAVSSASQNKADSSQLLQVLQSWQTRLNFSDEQKVQTRNLLEELSRQLLPVAGGQNAPKSNRFVI